MGELYDFKSGKFMNPNNWEDFGDNTCPTCGQKYKWLEGYAIELTEEQTDLLRRHAGV